MLKKKYLLKGDKFFSFKKYLLICLFRMSFRQNHSNETGHMCVRIRERERLNEIDRVIESYRVRENINVIESENDRMRE